MDFKNCMEYTRLSKADIKYALEQKIVLNLSFLVTAVSIGEQKNGGKFMSLTLVDKDKKEEAKLFGASSADLENVVTGKVFNAVAEVKEYDRSPTGYSIIVKAIEASAEAPSSYIQWTEHFDERLEQFTEIVNSVVGSKYFPFTYSIIQENWNKFVKWSAASGIHHNKLGGLLSHTTEVMMIANDLCDMAEELYPELPLDRGLVICGAMIHDIGKIEELEVNESCGVTEYSSEGTIVTHIMSGMKLVSAKAQELDYTSEEKQEDVNNILHIIGSHHGRKEWGCPVEPAMAEAEIVSYADLLSAVYYRYCRELGDLEQGQTKSSFIHGTRINIFRPKRDNGEIEEA